MPKLLLKYSLIITIVSFVLACEDMSHFKYDVDDILVYHHDKGLDSASMREQLIGKWTWKYDFCCGEMTSFQSSDTHSGLSVSFHQDGIGIMADLDTIIPFEWMIAPVELGVYEIVSEPQIKVLNGRMLFFEEMMMCNNSINNAEDHVFQKIQYARE